MELKNKKWSLDDFIKTRRGVLNQWPTGKEIAGFDWFDYLSSIPEHKLFHNKLIEAKKKGKTLVQPRSGVALVPEHIALLKYLQDEAEADLLSTTIDSYTRQNRYRECKIGIEESKKQKRSLLNGFPAVNYGVVACRKVLEAVNLPIQARHGTPDARLLSEIVHAAGWSANEGGGISYNIPYTKNVSIEKSLLDWQYCDRLVGFYEENGFSINREPFGALTGTLVPPGVSNSVAIIEALLSAEQGVKHITVGYGQCGHIIQDTAAIRALEAQTNQYLQRYGYHDVTITTVLHQWMGAFPPDEAKAFGIIGTGAITAALSGVTKIISKSPHEALGVPTMEANAQGVKATKIILGLLNGQTLPVFKELEEEIEIVKGETKCIVEKVFELGKGDLAIGTVRAFAVGVLDIPFSPSINNLGKMIPARDNTGAVRYLEPGNIPLTRQLKKFHHEKMRERAVFENRSLSFKMVADDVVAISSGQLIGRGGKASTAKKACIPL